MTNKQTTRHLFAILLMLILGTLTSAPLVRAQKPAEAKASSPSGGPKEGIEVHGHWTIDIRNPDGKLVTHREFENALTTSGAAFLGRFLQRTHKPGEWVIQLGSPLGSETDHLNPCEANIVGPMPCNIYETTTQRSTSEASGTFNTMTITSEGGPNTNRTVLTGTAKAQKNGLINTVSTLLYNCPVDDQGVCSPSVDQGYFTQTSLATPINVVAGQIIQVKVVISFS